MEVIREEDERKRKVWDSFSRIRRLDQAGSFILISCWVFFVHHPECFWNFLALLFNLVLF